MDKLKHALETSAVEQARSSTKEEVIREAKRIEESTIYSAKGHFSAARMWGVFHIWIGLAIAILSAIAAAYIFSDGHQIWIGYVTLVVVILTAITTFLNPSNRMMGHQTFGNKYDALSNKARIFWTIDCWAQNATDEILTSQLKDLSNAKNELNASAPGISRWAYLLAKRGLRAGEADFAVDKEQSKPQTSIG